MGEELGAVVLRKAEVELMGGGEDEVEHWLHAVGSGHGGESRRRRRRRHLRAGD